MGAFESLRNTFVKAASGSGTLADPWVPTFGSDQSTPGTSDLTTPRYRRPSIIKPAITVGNSYSANQNIGGVITVATGLVSTSIVLNKLHLALTGTITTSNPVNAYIFDANPAASTFTDTSAAVLAAADIGKLVHFASVAPALTGAAASAAAWAFLANGETDLQTDSSGNVYLAFVAIGTLSFTLTGQSLRVGIRS